MFRTDDPGRDFAVYDREQSRMLERLPVCHDCGDPIQDDHLFAFGGRVYCPECVDINHRKHTEEYIA